MDLLVLGQLLLELGDLGLQSRLLQDLGFLVRIDDLGGNKLVEGLSSMLAQEGIGLGGMSLRGSSVSRKFTREVLRVDGKRARTIFLLMLRMFLCEAQISFSNATKKLLHCETWHALLELLDVGALERLVLRLIGLVGGARASAGSGRLGALNGMSRLLLGRLGGVLRSRHRHVEVGAPRSRGL